MVPFIEPFETKNTGTQFKIVCMCIFCYISY